MAAATHKELTTGKPLPLILVFSLPVLLGNILQQAYSLVDAFIVGHFLGLNDLASVGASSSVIFLIIGFCNGSSGGFAIPIAQRFGARDYSQMRKLVVNSYYVTAILSVSLAIVTSLMCGTILRWMKTPDVIFDGAYKYLLVTFIGIPFTFFYNLLSGIIRALGDSRTPFWFLVFSTVLNIVLDVVFILGFRLGVMGASIATLFAQAISTFLCVLYIKKKVDILQASKEEKKMDGKCVGSLFSIGVPMGLQFSITGIGSIMLQSSNNALGTICCAAFTTGMRLKMFFMTALESLGIAMATYCGQNYGAGRCDRILQGIKSAGIIALTYTAFVAVILWTQAENLSALFVDRSQVEVIRKSAQFLHISVSFYPVLSLLVILRYSIQGVGYTKLSMLSGVSEMIARILVSLLLVPAFGYTAVCFGDPTAWIFADSFLVPAFIYVFRQISRKPAPTYD